MLSLLEHWRDVLLAIAFMAYMFEYNESKSLKQELLNEKITSDYLTSNLDMLNTQIDAIKVDYEDKLKALPKEITKIETRYKTIYQKVEVIKESNASCEDTISHLNISNY